LAVLLAVLSACAPRIAVTPRIVKLGLVAPFEGRARAIGYDALFAAKLALHDGVASDADERIELVALDSGASPDALARQARSLAVDPDLRAAVVVVAPGEVARAREAYVGLRVPVRVVAVPGTGLPADDAFARRYGALAGGQAPGAAALPVYQAVGAVLTAPFR